MRWKDVGTSNSAAVEGLSALSDGGGLTIHVREGRATIFPASVVAENVEARLDADGLIYGVHAKPRQRSYVRARPMTSDRPVRILPPPGPPEMFGRGTRGLKGIRQWIDGVAASVSTHLRPDAELSIDALTWRLASTDPMVSIGPGPLKVQTSGAFHVIYATAADGTSSTLRCQLLVPFPPNVADASLFIDGGPVSLAELGIKDGAAGLLGVDTASFSGSARLVLDAEGSALTFDTEGGAPRRGALATTASRLRRSWESTRRSPHAGSRPVRER